MRLPAIANRAGDRMSGGRGEDDRSVRSETASGWERFECFAGVTVEMTGNDSIDVLILTFTGGCGRDTFYAGHEVSAFWAGAARLEDRSGLVSESLVRSYKNKN